MSELTVKEMSVMQKLITNIKFLARRFRRRFIPYLVFYGQEVDVQVTWKEDRLRQIGGIDGAMTQLNRGRLFEIEKMLSEIGIGFDRGLSPSGRDWEWDWSLSGPVNLKFRGVCKTEEKRQ